jgi:hypothetical protein
MAVTYSAYLADGEFVLSSEAHVDEDPSAANVAARRDWEYALLDGIFAD